MTTLSQPTVGLLIDIAAERFTRPNLGTLLMRADLTQYRLGASLYTKKDLVLDALAGARAAAEDGDQAAHRGLLTFARLVVSKLVSEPDRPSGWFDELCEALLADGYQLTWEYVAPDPAAEDAPPVIYKILPTDAGPVPLAGEIGALEHELATRGYGDALNHYRQATEALSSTTTRPPTAACGQRWRIWSCASLASMPASSSRRGRAGVVPRS